MRVAVLGGGYAGVVLTTRLERSLPPDADLVLVDEDGTHLVQHELHRAIRDPAYGDTIEVPLEDVVDRAEVVADRVVDVDADDRVVTLAEGDPIEYDVAAVCLGADPAFYDIPGLATHATPLKRLAHAERIHADLATLVSAGDGRIVVGGAGLAGVQTAGEIAEYVEAHETPGVDVVLLEQADTVTPRFGPAFRRAVHDHLLERSVDVRTSTEVTAADEEGVALANGERVAADLLVWTGGITGTEAMGHERPVVRSDLALDERTFVVGDAARAIDVDGEEATPAAQTAVGEARVAATNIERIVAQGPTDFRPRLDRYNFQPYGWVVSVGDGVVASVGGQVLTGQPAKALKSTVGLGYLATSGAIREAVSVLRREFGFVGIDGRSSARGASRDQSR
ncbi:MAG: NAD(P)/FAD-dependent oxidoreductase [Halanaeroarchaeum sp.]